MAGYREARLYAYSNARIKAMESKLVRGSTLSEISKMEDASTMLARLLQTDYREYIEAYGDVERREELIDFALNDSLAAQMQKLLKVVPKRHKNIMATLTGMWDIYNIKFILFAKSTGRELEHTMEHLVEVGGLDRALVRDALSEPGVEGAAKRLMKHRRYRQELAAAVEAYKKTGSMMDANAAIDKTFYEKLGKTVKDIRMASREAARMVQLDIDMKNIITLLRAKKYGMPIPEVSDMLITNGATPMGQLMRLYSSADSVKDIANGIRSFDLKKQVESFESGKERHMLLFEIGMRNSIFRRALKLIRSSVLSFGVVIGYFYLKEIEVFTLRILMMGRLHGLSEEDIAGMIEWQL